MVKEKARVLLLPPGGRAALASAWPNDRAASQRDRIQRREFLKLGRKSSKGISIDEFRLLVYQNRVADSDS